MHNIKITALNANRLTKLMGLIISPLLLNPVGPPYVKNRQSGVHRLLIHLDDVVVGLQTAGVITQCDLR